MKMLPDPSSARPAPTFIRVLTTGQRCCGRVAQASLIMAPKIFGLHCRDATISGHFRSDDCCCQITHAKMAVQMRSQMNVPTMDVITKASTVHRNSSFGNLSKWSMPATAHLLLSGNTAELREILTWPIYP